IVREYNPYRYRGYYFDAETEFYYVSSRYYDPEIGRWINADNNFSNYNLFMYCGNNPTNRIDPNGEHWYYLWIDDLIEAVDELMASMSNIVYGRAAFERSFYDPSGASDLWNSRPYQDITPSQEMQIFTEFIYDHDFVADVSISIDTTKANTYVKSGVSKVFSPSKNINATYVHAGGGQSTSSVLPINITYSIGIVKGVNVKENYAKSFFDYGGGAIYGFDYCFWPNGSSAYSFTIGTSYGIYAGYDYYWCLD
ncbi:MAG: RHS repeat-associated core domain-containing protein, partial [Agathobacter sp.]